MAHTAQEPIEPQLALQFGSANIASRFSQFKDKGTMRRIVFILLLNPEENPKDFFEILKDFEKNLKLEIDASYLPELMKNIYLKNTESQVSTSFNAEELSSKLIKRSKQLLDEGEIQKAQTLISKARTLPNKIAEILQSAEAAYKARDYSLAGTNYETASKLLLDLDETTLMQHFHDLAEKVKKIPLLLKERKEFIESANKSLKKVDFSTAIEWFKAAAKHSEELEDKIKAEEYFKKAIALENFLDAEREAKLKESKN
ncbi:MAG: hypothetical protein ACTSRS_10850 [Candidatus Helarchaeota archaeon]